MQSELALRFRSILKGQAQPTIQWLENNEEHVLSASAIWNCSLSKRHEWRRQGLKPGDTVVLKGSHPKRLYELMAALIGGFAVAIVPDGGDPDFEQLERVSQARIFEQNDNDDLELVIDRPDGSQMIGAVVWLQTSGSTGKPKWIGYHEKGILHQLSSHAPFFSSAASSSRLCLLPNSHAFGLILDQILGLWLGQSLFFMPPSSMTIRSVRQYLEFGDRITIALVPRQLDILLRSIGSREYLNGVQLSVHTGGGIVRQSLIDQASELGIEIIEGYGLTELGPGVLMNGKPQGCQVKLEHTKNGVGEVYVLSPSLGIFDNGDRLDTDGYYRTGDWGRYEKNSRLTILGRQGDMLKTCQGTWMALPELEETLIKRFGFMECVIENHQADAIKVKALVGVHYQTKNKISSIETFLLRLLGRAAKLIFFPSDQSWEKASRGIKAKSCRELLVQQSAAE
ncbi:MAG: AMP-binding protein [Pseudobacteriovorax sp.]|nr:AMP-binding protein [Pseudobacteriovorax sp.]